MANKIRLCVFDWAGTTIDFGCRAPLNVFLQIFKAIDVPISVEEASKPMGMLKKDHIRELLHFERIRNEFFKKFNKYPDESNVNQLNDIFEPQLFKLLPDYSDPLPYVVETVNKLRENGIAIGSTSGYTKEMLNVILPIAEKKGFKPDFVISSSEVKQGRPVKIGDTIADINEGKSCGSWTVGVIMGSSLLGYTKEEIDQLTNEQLELKKVQTKLKFQEAGADFIIDSMKDLFKVIEEINKRLLKNEKPGGFQLVPIQPYLLYTPGPISTSKEVKLSMMQDLGSREKEYLCIVQNVRTKLCQIASPKASEAYTTIIVQGCGTFGVEACLGSVVPSNGKILIIVNGNYGERMKKIAQTLKIDCVDISFNEDEVPEKEKIEFALKNDKNITHVGLIHSETTTGILNPLDDLCALIKKYDKKLIVDAMSSFGGVPIDCSKLDIDFLISSPNKCFQSVPGFSYVIAKVNEIEKCKDIKRSVSFDLFEQWKFLENSNGGFRFTSPTHTIVALNHALKELDEEGGVSQRFKRYSGMQKILSEGMIKLNFKPMDLKGYQGPIITTFHSPKDKNYNFEKFYTYLKEKNCVIYPGKLTKVDTFRIGTIGTLQESDILNLLEQIKKSIFWDNTI